MSTYVEQARWRSWDRPAALLPATYPRSLHAAGGLPVLLPGLIATAAGATQIAGRLDALVLTGGPDVDPERYGQEQGPHTSAPRKERDAAELALLSAATDAGMPVLCICRGMQLLNVSRGGTLVQHLPDLVGHTGHGPAPGAYGRHEARVDAGSLLAKTLGRTTVDVPTSHHQAVDRLGANLVITARADDGTVEAIEDDAQAFLLGVQWHPEAGTDLALMEGLVQAAVAYRESRS